MYFIKSIYSNPHKNGRAACAFRRKSLQSSQMKREIKNIRIAMSIFDRDGSRIFAGSVKGKQVFSALVEQTDTPNVPTRLLLDFTDIDVATGSFLRESVYAYRTHARSQWPFLYPVIANASGNIVEELNMCLEPRSDAMISVTVNESGEVSKSLLIGSLDGKQRDAMRVVIERQEVDAPTLARDSNESATTWNNRLAALASKGLIVEQSLGRSKLYFPLVEGLKYGP